MLKYFEVSDFDCQETGRNEMDMEFLKRLDLLREAVGFPLYVTSGFRCPEGHSIEKTKATPGTHSRGIAADLAVSGGVQRRILVEKALQLDFKGVGVAQGFVHVDDRDTTPVMWKYKY